MSQRPQLYNPKLVCAAALLFTPIFGATLQAKNWLALGEPDNARASRMWIRSSLWLIAMYLVLQTLFRDEPVMDWLGPYFLIVLWGAWMLTSGWQQLVVVSKTVGKNYDSLPIGRAIILGAAGWLAYGLVSVTITLGLVLAGIEPLDALTEPPKEDSTGVIIKMPKEGGEPIVEPLPLDKAQAGSDARP